MADIEARSGLKARTIRDYIRQGWLKGPVGHGLAAVYTEEQLLRVTFIARMRARKEDWPTIGECLGKWSLKKLRAFVEETDPPAQADGTEAAPPHPEAGTTTELDVTGGTPDGGLPAGAHFVVAPVLPGLVLMLRHDAAPLVKRIASEILARYAATR